MSRQALAPWSVEWTIALRRRRLFALNVTIPLLLVLPVAVADPPPVHAAAVYTILFTFFGFFGSAIPMVRDGAQGILTRWRLAGLPDRALLTGRVSAQAAVDALEATPALVLVVLAGPTADPGAALLLMAALLFTLLVANVLGVWAAAIARSLAEAALFASVGALLLLHGAGVFRTPPPGTAAALVERVSPFRPLHEMLLEAAGGPAADASLWGPAWTGGIVVVLLTWAAAGKLVPSVARTREG